MTTVPKTLARASWLADSDELPHVAGDVPNWSENYLTYVWSPENAVGMYVHLCRHPGPIALWDEIVFIALPDDMWLVSKSIAPQRDVNGVSVNGIEWICDIPFQSWTKRFRGGAQLVSREQLASGAVADGTHIPVDMELACEGISATYDFGAAELDQAWATGHYEQHVRIRGSIRYGDQTVEVDGTGLRDHSWGPRDYSKIGYTTWVHGQFPESGRSFMAVRVTGVPPAPELRYGVVCTADGVDEATPEGLPIAQAVEDTETDYEFELTTASGTRSTLKAQILRATRCSFHGEVQLILGTDGRAVTNHDYVDAFTRFEWDGEVGYGVTERTVDHYPGSEPPKATVNDAGVGATQGVGTTKEVGAAKELADRLARFLAQRLPEASEVKVTDCVRITGGYSCVTTRFTAHVDGEPRVLLARADMPPNQRVLEPSDRSDEWALLSTLTSDGRVPTPKALFYDEDGSELGEKTIILEYIEGGSFLARVRSAPESALEHEADALCDLVADIHEVGLEGLPASMTRPTDWDSYVDGMIEQWREVEAEHIGSDPLFRYMATWLDKNRPAPTPFTLVHGEFQASNAVIGDNGELLAIDWEFAHIGDPREDLGWALWVGAVQPPDLLGRDLQHFCSRYCDRSGLGADIVNPLTVAYFSILPSIKVFRSVLEHQRGVINGENTSIQTAYMGGAIVTAQEQWLGAARNIQAAVEAHS